MSYDVHCVQYVATNLSWKLVPFSQLCPASPSFSTGDSASIGHLRLPSRMQHDRPVSFRSIKCQCPRGVGIHSLANPSGLARRN